MQGLIENHFEEDPTLLGLQNYDPGVGEIFIGSLLLLVVPVLELLAKIVHGQSDLTPASDAVTRTPDEFFANVRQPYAPNFYHHRHKGKTLRIHYLDESEGKYRRGNSSSFSNDDGDEEEVILCLHGEPFWSQSFHKVIPLLLRSGYRVLAPDLVGFGRSDKLIDHRSYSVGLHKDTILGLLEHLGLLGERKGPKITILGHNWGALLGGGLIKDGPPELFRRFVILNTNNFPDGELTLGRFPSFGTYFKYKIATAFFLGFRALIDLTRTHAPLDLIFRSLNPGFSRQDLLEFSAPFARRIDRGGAVSFPLLVPLRPDDANAREFREIRSFFRDRAPKTLIAFSEAATLPFSGGDYVIGNRLEFVRAAIPSALTVRPRIRGGHLVMHDNPRAVAEMVHSFIQSDRRGSEIDFKLQRGLD